MTMHNVIRVVAGSMVLASLALGLLVSKWWFCLTAFVGLNLIQSAFTHFCPAEKIAGKLGVKPCCDKK